MHLLNPTATIILANMDKFRSIKSLSENLLLSFSESSVTKTELTKDAIWLAETLENKGLLEDTRLILKSNNVEEAVITEYEMTQVQLSYIRPNVDTYSLDEMRTRYGGGIGANFSDHWVPEPNA
jgi:hypothetical protein